MQYAESAYYIISIAGKMSSDVIEILSNFYIGEFALKNRDNITFLEGIIKDQAALSGLLSYLTDLHYILLSVHSRKEINSV